MTFDYGALGGSTLEVKPALAIDPRIRERRDAVLRATGRRRLRVLLAAVAVLCVAGGAVGALFSPLLEVKKVALEGESAEPTAQILSAAGLSGGRHMIAIDPVQISHRLQALPWVLSAAVSRRWPTTVVIRIRERHPVAQVVAGAAGGPTGSFALVDGTGRVLALQPSASPGIPVLSGIGAAEPPGSSLGPLAALQLAAGLPQALAGRVLTVNAGPDGALSATLATPGGRPVSVVFGRPSELTAKLAALTTVLAQVPIGGVGTIDLRVPDRPALTDVTQPASVSTTSRG
ncbi:MAG: cell division protein FtsQ/DivIB [Acidimicrobiales bacterium]